MTSGARIKSFRNQKGIRQKEPGDHLHASFQIISKWENDENEPDVSSLIELSKVFACSLDALLGENEEQEKKKIKVRRQRGTNPINKRATRPHPKPLSSIKKKCMYVRSVKKHSGR